MPIFLKGDKAILFVHIPKTGGSSIKRLFESMGWRTVEHCSSSVMKKGEPNWYRTNSPQHQNAVSLRRLFRIERFDKVLTFVRHPVDRLVSEFFWRNRSKMSKFSDTGAEFEKWWRESHQIYLSDAGYLDNHLRPQCEFLLPEATVGSFESDLSPDYISQVLSTIGENLPIGTEFPRLNEGQNADNFSIRDVVLQEIEEFYATDFQVLAYERVTG